MVQEMLEHPVSLLVFCEVFFSFTFVLFMFVSGWSLYFNISEDFWYSSFVIALLVNR